MYYHRTKPAENGLVRYADRFTTQTSNNNRSYSAIEFAEGTSDITIRNLQPCEIILPDSVMALQAPREPIIRLNMPELAYRFEISSKTEITNPEVLHKIFVEQRTDMWQPKLELVAEGSDNSTINSGCHLCAGAESRVLDVLGLHICALSHPLDPYEAPSNLIKIHWNEH